MSIKLEGVDQAFSRFKKLKEETRPQAMSRLARVIYDEALEGVDSHTKPGGTGKLFLSLKLTKKSSGYEIWHDTRQAPYAAAVHWGSRPHRIEPRNKKALRWPAGSGSATKFFFSKGHRHPGFKGDPWLVNAAKIAGTELDAIIDKLDRSL